MPKAYADYLPLDPRFTAVMDRLAGGLPAGSPDFGSVWRAIVQVESAGNASAIGDSGTSFGYLQLHQNGGQGTGYTAAQLLDPATNAEIGGRPIARAYLAGVGAGLSGQALLSYTAVHSGHPVSNGDESLPAVQTFLRVLAVAAGYLQPDGSPVVTPPAGPAPDVPATAPQAQDLQTLRDLGVIQGTGTPADDPAELVSRAEMEQTLARLYAAIMADVDTALARAGQPAVPPA